jgi:hypothetical protein
MEVFRSGRRLLEVSGHGTTRQYRRSQPNCRCSNTRENRNSFFCAPRLDHEPTLARPASLLFRSRAFRQFSYGEHCLGLKSTTVRHLQKSLLPARANIKRLRNTLCTSRLTITSSLAANHINRCFHWLNDLIIHYKISNS